MRGARWGHRGPPGGVLQTEIGQCFHICGNSILLYSVAFDNSGRQQILCRLIMKSFEYSFTAICIDCGRPMKALIKEILKCWELNVAEKYALAVIKNCVWGVILCRALQDISLSLIYLLCFF